MTTRSNVWIYLSRLFVRENSWMLLLGVFFLPILGNCQKVSPKKLDKWVKSEMPTALKMHRQLVSIPNVPLVPTDMQRNIEWLRPAFKARGFEVKILKTPSIPVFLAERTIDFKLPTVLFYMHMDGQPVDASKWDQKDPFEPVIKNRFGAEVSYDRIDDWDPEWRIYARAAADDKGPIIMFLHALRIMEAKGIQPAFNIKVLLDGEEESGSEGLLSTLEQYRDQYRADHLIIMDGPAHITNRPTLTFGCRGIASATLTVFGPSVPQHSGHFGNYAPNPVFKMAHLLASMKTPEGKVVVKGFYEGIDFDEKTRKILADVPDNEEVIQNRLGIAAPDDVGNGYQESLQYPSLNVRGMASAWIGKQTRTIVPDKAVVQLGIRLVPETDGARMLNLVKAHIQDQGYLLLDREPRDEERKQHPNIASFTGNPGVNAFRTELESASGEWLTRAIQKGFKEDPVRIRIMGGTVPMTPMIQALGIPAVIVPMVNMDNNQHSPNENLRVGNLYNGIKTCLSILTETI